MYQKISLYIAKIGQFWQESINSRIFRWNIILIIFQFAYSWYKFNDLPPEIPLYYSRPWGAEQLANSSSIFLLPILSITVLIINNLFAVLLLRSNSLLSRLLVITSLIFTSFSLFTIIKSIGLVG